MERINRWYYDNFKDKYAKLLVLRTTAKEKDIDKIDETLSIMEALFFQPEQPSVKDELIRQADFVTSTEDYHYIAEEFAFLENVGFKPKNIYFPDLSDDELLGLIHDFYRDMTDKEIFKTFRGMFKKRDKLLHMTRLMESEPDPLSFILPYFNEVHICVKRTNSLTDMVNLGHEYGHGIQFLTNFHNNIFGTHDIFFEIVSLFFELLLLEYMKDIPEFSSATIQKRKDLLISYSAGGEDFMILTKLMYLWEDIKNLPFMTVKKILEGEVRDMSSGILGIEDVIDSDYTTELPYLVGYSIAVELLMIYLEDRELGLFILKELMNIDLSKPREEYFESILNLGLTPCENLEDYKRHIILPK